MWHSSIDLKENRARMQRGELYYAFTPDMLAARARCTQAVNKFNDTRETTRRRRIELWRDIVQDERPMPPELPDEDEDAAQFEETDPWIEPPLRCDYGTQVKIAAGSFVNFGAIFLDTLPITIGARTIIGPNCGFYSATHPLDPAVRDGLHGPELGKEIVIGDDCWFGGNVTILPGVTVGRGAVVGAGSVVTKDVPAFHVVAGNPAKVLRRIETAMDSSQKRLRANSRDAVEGAEAPMAEAADPPTL